MNIHFLYHALAAKLITGVVLIMSALAMAQVPAREPDIDANRQVVRPFFASATPATGGDGLTRIYLSGDLPAKTRVVASLVIYSSSALSGDTAETPHKHPLTLVSAPLLVNEAVRTGVNPGKDWSVSFTISPDLSVNSEVYLYIERTDGPTDTGQRYLLRIGRLLPPRPTTEAVK